jgi:integrase
VEAM